MSTPARARALCDEERRLVAGLAEIGAVRFGSFTLKSGAASPVYLDLRLLVSAPQVLARAARAYARVLADVTFDRLAAIPYAGLPIGTAIALEMDVPLVYPRREVKEYGRQRAVEGHFEPGETVALIDDLVSEGGSKIEAVEPLVAVGLVVRDVVVLIDREQGATDRLAGAGLALHSVLTLGAVVDELERAALLEPDLAERVRAYQASLK